VAQNGQFWRWLSGAVAFLHQFRIAYRASRRTRIPPAWVTDESVPEDAVSSGTGSSTADRNAHADLVTGRMVRAVMRPLAAKWKWNVRCWVLAALTSWMGVGDARDLGAPHADRVGVAIGLLHFLVDHVRRGAG
jgi:hypothetical protein